MKVRVGIDVGGTFTDAALINNETFELIDTVKVPTTHASSAGVAEGIVQVLRLVMERNHVQPEDVVFIAHGTTQATNALLEGDVVPVGIVTLGSGIQGAKSKSDTKIGDIPLTASKALHTENSYVETNGQNFSESITRALDELSQKGCKSVVASEAFSVDDATNENAVTDACREMGIPATATNQISQLYGLKVRTRTAVINASIMPKMLDAANMTEDSIIKAGIKTPLMVMRCDGGVMTVNEVRKRPIMTILSGPAAGVAGALMYEKLTDGIFLEVGGTSTDISCVKNGKVQVKYAIVGGHKTYLNSLDVRTVGIGGGSMVQIREGKIVEVGPRSVHIAGMAYEVYSDPAEIVDPVLKCVRPLEGDPEYGYVECANGKKFALSLSGAANIAGYVKDGDYAKGNVEAARKAWKSVADQMGISVEEAAIAALNLAAKKNAEVVNALMNDYSMNPRTTVLVGGGGGASSVVPHLAEKMGFKSRNSKNAAVISTIGVALAMVRDMVERTIPNPSDNDILTIRREAEEKVIAAGANPATVEVTIEVDASKNLVRATAIGTTELRSKDLANRKLDLNEIKAIVANSMETVPKNVEVAAENGAMYAMQYKKVSKKLFGLMKSTTMPTAIVDEEGVIRLQKQDGHLLTCRGDNYAENLTALVERNTDYLDGTRDLPNIYVIFGKRIIDLSGLEDISRVMALAKIELSSATKEDQIMLLCSARTD